MKFGEWNNFVVPCSSHLHLFCEPFSVCLRFLDCQIVTGEVSMLILSNLHPETVLFKIMKYHTRSKLDYHPRNSENDLFAVRIQPSIQKMLRALKHDPSLLKIKIPSINGITVSGFSIFPDAITVEEEKSLVDELTKARELAKKPYLNDHFDSVIVGFRETERSVKRWTKQNQDILIGLQKRLENVVDKNEIYLWRPLHVIDLNANGYILPHIDSTKHAGDIICGLSLLSTRIMGLVIPQDEFLEENQTKKKYDNNIKPNQVVMEGLLPPRSIYAITGMARYDLAHEILAGDRTWDEKVIKCERRFSVMFRREIPPTWMAPNSEKAQ